MQMAQLQHWSVTCTTCDSPAEYHCNTCGDILCPRCREIHQRSRATGHHSVVPYSERVEPGKLTGHCDRHPGQVCTIWCQTCEKAACTLCVTSKDHTGHAFIQMLTKLDDQRNLIRNEFDKYSKLLKQWEDSLQHIQNGMKAYEDELEELGRQITTAADKVCKGVRSIEATLQKHLQDIKKTEINLQQEQEKALLTSIASIKQRMNEAEDRLRSEDVGVLLHYKTKEDKEDLKHPPERKLSTWPVFTPGEINVESLKIMLGNISTEKDEEHSKKKGVHHPSSKSVKERDAATVKGLPHAPHSSTSNKMIPVISVISTKHMNGDCIPNIACTGSGLAWIKLGIKKLQLIDRQEKVKKTINTDFSIGGTTITPQGDFIVSDFTNYSIRSVSENGSVSTLFKTTWAPFGVCCLQNGDVVVAFGVDCRVVQYSRKGKLVRELDKSYFRHPCFVAQSSINKHLYITDKSGTKSGDPGRLMAFSMDSGKLVFEYTGPDDATFTPCNIRAGQTGLVIVTDIKSHRIHVLDQEGKFLQYLLTKDQGLQFPFDIDLDSDGYIWVSEDIDEKGSQIKIMRYII